MSSFLRSFLRRTINNAVHHMGFEIVRKGWEPRRLRKDFDITTLIDIGIGVKQGTPDLYTAFPQAQLLLIDPNPISWTVMDGILRDRKGFAAKMAAGPQPEQLNFYSYPDAPGVSSFLRREEHAHLRVEILNVDIEPLDVIVQRSGLSGPYGLKIDTEGYELAALRGASETLKTTEFVLFESQVSSIEPKPYSQGEIFGFLEAAGFELHDIVWVAYEHVTQRTRQVDLMFRRRACAADLSIKSAT